VGGVGGLRRRGRVKSERETKRKKKRKRLKREPAWRSFLKGGKKKNSLSFLSLPNSDLFLFLLLTMMYEISALDTTALPREAETTREAGEESSDETDERRRLDWIAAAVEADRCCLGPAITEAETAIALLEEHERTGALARGQKAREVMVVLWSNFEGEGGRY